MSDEEGAGQKRPLDQDNQDLNTGSDVKRLKLESEETKDDECPEGQSDFITRPKEEKKLNEEEDCEQDIENKEVENNVTEKEENGDKDGQPKSSENCAESDDIKEDYQEKIHSKEKENFENFSEEQEKVEQVEKLSEDEDYEKNCNLHESNVTAKSEDLENDNQNENCPVDVLKKETDPKSDVSKEEEVNNHESYNFGEKEIKSQSKTEASDTSGKNENGYEENEDTVTSESSEKENIEESNKSISPDVIMLSDDEIQQLKMDNGDTHHRSKVLKKIKELQNQLRNEEATLVLLKKLRQSQTMAAQEPVVQSPAPKPPSHQMPSHLRQQPGVPPLLVRGGLSGPKATHSASQPMRGHPPGQSRSQQGPPPLVGTPRSGHNGQVPTSQQHISRLGTAPNSSRTSLNQRGQQQQQIVPQKPPVASPAPVQDTQTPAQRQAAAKQALRKQLEKTLLQIPPPKPPPPEMNFIPSLACPDFILLLGLEEVVNHMIDFQLIARGQKNPDERFVCTPFTCVQCNSDFTPVWKREKPGSKNVICEHCVTTNQKKALKQEHTNRLKSAFVKALQQEQEIERMQANSVHTPAPSSQTREPRESRDHNAAAASASALSAASAAAAAANAAAAAAAVASFRPSAEQLRQRHNFLQQAQQAQLRAGQPLGLQAFSHHTPFPYNLPFANQQELQRQYLLDMIPRGNMSWKQ